jgi:hypothetical protein
MSGSRKSRMKRAKARKKREQLKDFGRRTAKEGEWVVLFLGLMVSLAGAFVAFLAGEILYAVLFFLVGVLVGSALLKLEAE